MIETIPKLYILANPSDTGMIDKFLEDNKVKWRPDPSVSFTENLIEFAGRLCYWSFENEDGTYDNLNISKIREGNKNYIGNILKSGHGCYDKETEILTELGWKYFKDLTKSDRVATLNPSTHKIEYNIPTNYIEYIHTGKMYKIESNTIDLLVTPDHKLYCSVPRIESDRKIKNRKYKLVSAEQINLKSHYQYKGSNGLLEYSNTYKIENPLFFELIGFAIGDGNISGNILSFHLKKDRKINYLKDLCSKLNIDLNEVDNHYKINIKNYKKLFNIYNENKEKCIPDGMIFSDSSIYLLKGLINSDGSISKNNTIVYDTTSKILADQIQQLCIHIGNIFSNISQAECYKIRDKSFGDKPIYRLGISKRTISPEINRKNTTNSYSKSEWIEDFNDKVYCVEVENNIICVRRNGKYIWSGNSIFEHGGNVLLFNNVSRVFTHELCRHRTGTAFSQTSGRYVRYDSIPFWIPDSIKTNPEAVDIYKDLITKSEESIDKLFKLYNIDDEKSFDVKKKLTSAFRRIIPDGVSNNILFSANHRALRHIIELRTSIHAEEEIRDMFLLVAYQMRDMFPNIYQDMSINDDGECIFENTKI